MANSNLGYLTTYNLQDVYSYIGEMKIQEKILELKTKPTMGIRLEDFVTGKDVAGFYDKGPLYFLSLFIDWFSDSKILKYLFDKQCTYEESSYMKNSLWSTNRIKLINDLVETIQGRGRRQPSDSDIERIAELKKHLTYNYYYIDYHFFLISLYRKLPKDDDLKMKIYSHTLLDYPKKLEKIKQSMVDLKIWIERGLGNSIITALEKHCEKTNQAQQYESFFDKAEQENWRF